MSSKNSERRPDDNPTCKMGRQDSYSTQSHIGTDAADNGASSVNRRNPRKGGAKIAAMVATATLALICLAGIMAMSELTFMPAWIPWTIAIATALGTGMWGKHLWRRITDSTSDMFNYMMHTVITSLMICCGLYAGNQLGATDSGTTVEAEVVKVYSETRHHSRCVGRRYVRGDEYKVYFATLRLDNGTERDMPVSAARYRRLRRGMHLDVNVRRGGLGYGVIRPGDFTVH